MPNFCSMLGDGFKDHLGEMVKENINTLCHNPEDFVTKLIDLMKEKVTTKMKESHFIPSFVRIAMEKSLGMLNSQKSTLAIPLKAAMMAPPMLAACKAGDNKMVSEGIQKTIDAAFEKICGDSHVEEEANKNKNNSTAPKNAPKNNSKKNNKNKNNSANSSAAKNNSANSSVAKNNSANSSAAKNNSANSSASTNESSNSSASTNESSNSSASTNESSNSSASTNESSNSSVSTNESSNSSASTNNSKKEESSENSKAKLIEELKVFIDEITPKLKDIIKNQKEFKDEKNTEDKDNIKGRIFGELKS